MAATKKTASSRKPLEERNFTSKRVREEDEAEGIRDIKIPGKSGKTAAANKKK